MNILKTKPHSVYQIFRIYNPPV